MMIFVSRVSREVIIELLNPGIVPIEYQSRHNKSHKDNQHNLQTEVVFERPKNAFSVHAAKIEGCEKEYKKQAFQKRYL